MHTCFDEQVRIIRFGVDECTVLDEVEEGLLIFSLCVKVVIGEHVVPRRSLSSDEDDDPTSGSTSIGAVC